MDRDSPWSTSTPSHLPSDQPAAAAQATKAAAPTPASGGTASGQRNQDSGQEQPSNPSGSPKREGVTTLTDGRYDAYVRKVDPDRDLIVVDLVQVFTGDAAVQAELPPLKTVARPLEPPPATATPEKVAQGKGTYQVYCFYCHGDSAVSGGTLPDLRYSSTLASADAWTAIVLDGTLSKNGMISFSHHLKADDVEAIRAYVTERAHAEKKRLAHP